MLTLPFYLVSPRGTLGRGAYGAVMTGLLGCGFALWRSEANGAGAYVWIAIVCAMIWIFVVSLIKRLRDCGRSRAWILAPLLLALIAFPFGFVFYHPPAPLASTDTYERALVIVTVFPVIASGIAWVGMKVAGGLAAAAAVWGVFAAALLFPGARRKV